MRYRVAAFVAAAAALLAASAFLAPDACAQQEFRAFWVDAFHDGLKTPAQVDAMLADVRSSNCNAVVCQMRRRGDTYYPSPCEPFASDADPAFDALQYLIEQAHGGTPRVEVHAWLCTLPVAQSGAPANPDHPIYRHPEFLTKDNSTPPKFYDGSNYSFDPGHPGALDYVAELYLDVVRRYDVDGIHFDYVRFAGNAWGYNDVSVARYVSMNPGAALPLEQRDPRWMQWRRDQITALVRKVYAGAIAVNPNAKVSGSTITWGDGPANDEAWLASSSAYVSVLQDWRSWMEEGILDINMPMTYYRDWHTDSYGNEHRLFYDHWIAFQKDHRFARHLAIGPGIYLNRITDTLSQIRRGRETTPSGNTTDGFCFFSYYSTQDNDLNGSVDHPSANPEFYRALSQPSAEYPDPPFAEWVEPPAMPWKTAFDAPGHLMGTVLAGGGWVDGAAVRVTGPGLPPEGRTMKTDGTGFYAFIGLPPGGYSVAIDCPYGTGARQAQISAARVSTSDFELNAPRPVISDIRVSEITSNSVTVSWDTNIPATTQVEYGATRALGSATPESRMMTTQHSATVRGLAGLSAYYLQAVCNASSQSPSRSPVLCAVTRGEEHVIILDNTDGVPSDEAEWSTGTSATDKYGASYRFTAAQVGGTRTFRWQPDLPCSGNYEVYVWYPKGTNRSRKAPFTVYHDGGTIHREVNQQIDGTRWEGNLVSPSNIRLTPEGGVPFSAGTSGYVELSNNDSSTGKVLMADAVKFRMVIETDPPSTPNGLKASQTYPGSIALTWNPSTDASSVAGYTVYRDGLPVDAVREASFEDTDIVARRCYTYTVTAYDVYGNVSEPSAPVAACAAASLSTPQVIDEGDYTLERTRFGASWSVSMAGGVAQYRYALGTAPGAADLVGWTATTETGAAVTIPEVSCGTTCYFSVMAQNGSGTWSETGVSDGITVARPVSTIAEARALPDGEAVVFTEPKVVSAAFDGFCYIQEEDGTAGIRVEACCDGREAPAIVGGVLAGAGAERRLADAEVVRQPGSTALRPLAMACRSVGASGSDYCRATGAGQRATRSWRWVKAHDGRWMRKFACSPGLSSLGLLVTTWGRATWAEGSVFYIDDGSGCDETENAQPAGLRVELPPGVPTPAPGDYVSVTGVSSCRAAGGELLRLLRVRDADDVRPAQGW